MMTGMPEVSGSHLRHRQTFPAVHLGDDDVEQDQVGLLAARPLEGLGPRPREHRVVTVLGEVVPDQLGDVPLVLGHEHARRPRPTVLDGAPGLPRLALAVVSHEARVAPRRYGTMTTE